MNPRRRETLQTLFRRRPPACFPFDGRARRSTIEDMKPRSLLLALGVLLSLPCPGATVPVWEKVELTFHAQRPDANPYADVEMWVDLHGPGFDRRCYGFWDGGNTFRVRVVATAPGEWTWRSGSNQDDAGLDGHTGTFTATAWAPAELRADPLRRGFIRATPNGHAFEFADGTPYFLVGDTWYAAATSRFKWRDGDREYPIGPEAGFKDYVRLRQHQGFNAVAIIAAFPNWANDGRPWEIWIDQKADLGVRSAWVDQGDIARHRPRADWHAKDMSNSGGRAFLFPGKVPGYEDVYPDVDRINPAYFQALDRKVDYLNAHGIIPIIEVARRDMTSCWAKYYAWPTSYARYVEYVWSRYQANNCLLSPVHYDYPVMTATTQQLNAAGNLVISKYGRPPFGNLVSCNASVSSLLDFGGPEQNHWLTFHEIGNAREHDAYWYLTRIFRARPARPALNGEPYYAGMDDRRYPPYPYGAKGGTADDDRDVRSGMYGSFLSGGLAGHVYGAQGIWGADIEPGSDPTMWQAFQWKSADQMKYLREFALSEGRRYQDLVPDSGLVSPSETHVTKGFTGWAYAARTPDRGFFLAYFEADCPESSIIRGATPNGTYNARWFDPRDGRWLPVGSGRVTANVWGQITLPAFPSPEDWGLRLTAVAASGPK
jgi:Protein of unknown function (DUF4038)/Domain of unknown function (DUF5060)